MITEQECISMIKESSQIIGQEKAETLGSSAVAFNQSSQLVNDVEFWKWMGANYPKDLSNSSLIQQAALNKSHWLNTQIQGKGYEWDFMVAQRSDPLKLLSKFEAGDCPTQPGIDITETSVFNGVKQGTYQNKAYVGSNNPDLHNTPKDAVVVTNKEKVLYAQKQGYNTKEYMDADQIKSIRDKRFRQACSGNANTAYSLKNVATASVKAGVMGAVIGMTIETITLYKAWKTGELSDMNYGRQILKASGDAGVTAGTTTAIMVPVNSIITVAGVSSLVTIPVAIVLGSAINRIVAPCFGRGEYNEILDKAKYYGALSETQ